MEGGIMEKELLQGIKEIEKQMSGSEFFVEAEMSIQPLLLEIQMIDQRLSEQFHRPIVEYTKWRIKSPESIAKKLRKKDHPITFESALEFLHDLVGIRVICSFYDDVFRVAKEIRKSKNLKVLKVKNYIAHPKPSGYRSIHIIAEVPYGGGGSVKLEIQVRSAAMNYWATLDHELGYKNEKASQEEAEKIKKELRKCAIDIAQIDMRFQKLRDRIEKL
jgi:putative GTP pyrophosphokinase